MILFSINDKGIIIPYTAGCTAYTYEDDGDVSADLIISPIALYSYMCSEVARLESLVNHLAHVMMLRTESEDLRREPGWNSWIPSDLSD